MPEGSERPHVSLEPLRIGLVAPPWFEVPPAGYGGIEALVAVLTDALVARGHDVTLIGAGRSRTRAHFVATFAQPPSARLGESMPEAVHAATAGALLDALDLDIVHDHSHLGPLLARGRQVPTVVTAHGPVTGEPGDYLHALGDTVHMVAISDAQRALAPRLPWLATVHNAIPVSTFPYREDKDDYLVFLGRMCADKAPELAIALARATGRRLVMAAKINEPHEREYFDEVVRPLLGHDIDWVGEADGVLKRELLSRAAALVFPIQWEEPFGLVMVEAMACGTPVVALRRGSVPEVVADGVTGFVADSLQEMVTAIGRLDQLRAADCRALVEERFDVDVMAAGYEQAYRDALAEAPIPYRLGKTRELIA